MPKFRDALSLTAILALLPLSAVAQGLSAEEIIERLNAQRDLFSQTGEDGELGATRGLGLGGQGATRGLELVTVDGAAPAVSATETATVAADEAQPPAADEVTPVVFAKLDPSLQVNLQISFAFDSAAIEPSQKPTLDTMCEVIQGSDLERIRIVGHTDSAGTEAYNERLSTLRAREVARYFVDECGIAPERLETTGMGERFPLDGSDPAADENRRVEFQALS
ncbi:OmpA family protein [Jannaschia seohaensis]|uniref:Outer membrane protein OmpA n=1 Tax=Jannaschia seohaensis TaxID=475081 RepID=A0A2Y9C8E2_9RHOB|nr:OmpA family protein [Jannaschia seohaensis]PWJ16546.1 outer membrane protein OmpA-like peptidoglycan-associated protein [Jannaschia seohaensis]SSA48783.1 Outer membrane protein OmpA [Jannaschia seohaensis]